MPMYRLPDGTHAHMKLAGPPAKWPKPCQAKWRDTTEWCACMAEFQCDWKLRGGGTCDKHLCKPCALSVGNNKHLCPDHRVAYAAWLQKKAEV